MSRAERAARSVRDLRTAAAAVKLVIFVIVSVLVTGTLAMVMGRLGFGAQHEFHAVFTSATQLNPGDDVRVAGVSVGRVENVGFTRDNQALVTFKVDEKVPMTTASGVQIRYLNLVGDRYLALTEGKPGAPRLQPGATIPERLTTPAINLTELFNGFQPLFDALDPKDVNDLSLSLIKVLQGEGGTVRSLLAHTASLTSSLADRDQLVSEVVTNLTQTLSTVDQHHTQLSQLLTQLNSWMTDLARDKVTIGDSVKSVADLSDELAGLLVDIRPHAKADIAELKRVMTILNKPENQAVMNETLNRLPKTLKAQARIGSYGSWYNYYLCDLDLGIILPSLGKLLDSTPVVKALRKTLRSVAVYSTADRCTP